MQISNHISAIHDLSAAISRLEDTIKLLPEGKDRYRLEARIELLKDTEKTLRIQSGELYDKLLNFCLSASL